MSKILVVDSANEKHTNKQRILLSSYIMNEISVGIGDMISLETPQQEDAIRGRRRQRLSDKKIIYKAFGQAWPSQSASQYSIIIFYYDLLILIIRG